MKLFFSNAGWRTGGFLLLNVIRINALTFLAASHDWRDAANLLTLLNVVSLVTAAVFGFAARIGTLGRILWLVLVLGYITLLGVQFYRFEYSPNILD
jgi:hypothetical protein